MLTHRKKDKIAKNDFLKNFQTNNKHSKCSIDRGLVTIETPWGSECSSLVFDINNKKTIHALNNFIFPPYFDMAIHVDTNLAELFFGFIPSDKDPYKQYISHEFEFYFDGIQYECFYKEPSENFYEIVKSFKRLYNDKEDILTPQLDVYKDSLKIGDLPPNAKLFFSKRVAKNFYIKASKPFTQINIVKLARNLNFAMRYYDRRSPLVIIRAEKEADQDNKIEWSRFIEKKFPKSISIEPLDDFMLQLIEVARITNYRFAFLYYYQVIEYAGFYFIDNKAKKDLRQLLRDPTMISCEEDKLTQLFALISDMNHADDAKMKRVIEEYCNPTVIWNEIINDKDFFTQEIKFDGGFEISALISKDTTVESWKAMWMPKLYDTLTKIRNCLVHARERRQCSVISPTKSNNYKIKRYLPVIARISEQITLNK